MTAGRPGCYAIPSERIVMLWWVKGYSPTGWAKLWAKITRAWKA